MSDADRVRVTVRVEETGDILFDAPFAPFDAERGEVLIACQRHFAALPPNIMFEVHSYKGAAVTSESFTVPHRFDR
mgnify:CR=1 FL=1